MGRIFYKRSEYGIPISSYTRCMNCNKLIILNEIIQHVKKCLKLFIDDFNQNMNAKRFHIILYTLGIEEKFSKNFISNEEIRSFTLKLYENLLDVREYYPNHPWKSDLFNFQELFILNSLFHALEGYNVRIPSALFNFN